MKFKFKRFFYVKFDRAKQEIQQHLSRAHQTQLNLRKSQDIHEDLPKSENIKDIIKELCKMYLMKHTFMTKVHN